MMKEIVGMINVVILCVMGSILLCDKIIEWEYEAIKKYYPDMTKGEYIALHKHLMIPPTEEK